MCNDFKLETDVATILAELEEMRFRINLPENTPNVPAREDIRMTDMAPIIRMAGTGEHGIGELVNRRWSWPGPKRKPVYNFAPKAATSPRTAVSCRPMASTSSPILRSRDRSGSTSGSSR